MGHFSHNLSQLERCKGCWIISISARGPWPRQAPQNGKKVFLLLVVVATYLWWWPLNCGGGHNTGRSTSFRLIWVPVHHIITLSSASHWAGFKFKGWILAEGLDFSLLAILSWVTMILPST